MSKRGFSIFLVILSIIFVIFLLDKKSFGVGESEFFESESRFHALAPPYPGVWKRTRLGFKSEKSTMRISPESLFEIKRYIPRVIGEVKCVVLLAEFQDRKFKVEIKGESYPVKEYFKEMLFGGEKNSYYKFPTFREYWEINSRGKFKVDGEVFGPYTVPGRLSDYACGSKNASSYYYCGIGLGVDNLVKDLINVSDNDIDFSKFDGNGDGQVDCLIVIHAGKGAETQDYGFQDSRCCDIWSRAFQTSAPTSDGVSITSGVVAAGISEIFPYGNMGLIAHEFGHLLGLVDLYDTGSDGIPSCGVGVYSLMGYGLYKGNPPGTLPANLSPWEKIFLGWAEPQIVSDTFCDSLSSSSQTDWFVKVPAYKDVNSDEYFLVEYRKKELFDADFPSEGIMIWHIDESVIKNNISKNKVNMSECYPGCGKECGEIKDAKGNFLTCKKHYGVKVVIPLKYDENKGIFNNPWRFEMTSTDTDSVKCLISEPNDFWKSGDTFPEIYTSAFGYKGEPHNVVIAAFGDQNRKSIGATTRGDEIRFASPKIEKISKYNWAQPGGEYEGIMEIEGTPPIYISILSPPDAWLELYTKEGGKMRTKNAVAGEEKSSVKIIWSAPPSESLIYFSASAENCIDKIQENWSVKVQNPTTSLDSSPQNNQGIGCSCRAVEGNSKDPIFNILFITIIYIIFFLSAKVRIKNKAKAKNFSG